MADSIDWGICDGCDSQNKLLTSFEHHPTLKKLYLCNNCANGIKGFGGRQIPEPLANKIEQILSKGA